MACPCCNPPAQCCCDGDRVVQTTEGCSPTTPAFPGVTPEDISAVCDWGGLTIVMDEPFISGSNVYYGGSAVGGASFSCTIVDNDEPLAIFERSMGCNFRLFDAGGGCFTLAGAIDLIFSGTYVSTPGSYAIRQNQVIAYPNVCQTSWESEIADLPLQWCPNPYGSSVTTEIIIAP